MNGFKRNLLLRNEETFYADVTDPTDIITFLQSENILRDHEIRAISSSNNQTAKLVNILLNKSDGPWFEKLVESLKKDYEWISDSLKNDFESKHEEKLTYYLRGKGNVPPLPQHNITRQDYVKRLREKIKVLTRDSYLVVHGMSGAGKTSLVVDSLQSINLLEDSLGGSVYWLSVGDLQDNEPDDLLCRQLQQKLCELVELPINNQQNLLLALKSYFSVKPNYSALLVLDKVRSSKVVDALAIGCKILVTTQDYDVVKQKGRNVTLFPVKGSFSEDESVQLLQDFVCEEGEILKPALRDIAANIHRVWKGHPMAIGLIGGELSEFKEESQKHVSRWKAYEKAPFYQGNFNEHRRSLFEEQMNSIIRLTTNKLNEKNRNLLHMLAVLVEDTNITTNVLEILWNMPKNEVQEVVDHFYRRSLVFKKFNANLKMPVYGIHDIIMKYLKKEISNSEIKIMHRDFISKYLKVCKGNFADLPQDNYIYSYLCLHIENGNEWKRFQHQFYSLEYIKSKLMATSPADLLLDLSKYYSGLVEGVPKYCSAIDDIKKFVNDSGWDIHQGELDVVQCALLQPKESFVFQQAASMNPPPKVLFQPLSLCERRNDLEKTAANVTAVSIIGHSTESQTGGRILMYPDPDGEESIVELDMQYRRSRRSFKEKSRVVSVKMSPLRDKFVSALEDGGIRIWNLNQSESNADTPPPSLRQSSYLHHFPDKRTTPSSSFQHSRKVTCVCFSDDGKLIVSTADDRTVRVWNLEDNRNELTIDVHPNPIATSCCFLNGNSIIVYGCQNSQVFFYNLKTQRNFCYDLGFNNYGLILNLLCMSDEARKLLVVQERQVLMLTWEDEILMHRRQGPRPSELTALKKSVLHEEKTRIMCSVYNCNHFLLLGTSDGCLLLSDLLSKIVKFKFGSGEIRAVDMIGECIVFAQTNSVKMCWLKSGQKYKQQPMSAHLGWIVPNDVSVYTTATSHGNIKVYHDGKEVCETFHLDVCVVRVSTYGHHVLIGMLDGKVLLFDSISRNFQPLEIKFSSEVLYLSVGMYNAQPLLLAAAKSDETTYELQGMVLSEGKCHCINVSAPVVKTFICSDKHCMLTILNNYAIMVCDLRLQGMDSHKNSCCVQEGRLSAKVTDACLSPKKNVLVITDEELCFHVVSLHWRHSGNTNNVQHHTHHGMWNERDQLPQIMPQLTDEVDGMSLSVNSDYILKASLSTYELLSASLCCCVCPKGKLTAIGHDNYKIRVWEVKKSRSVLDFSIFPNRRTQLRQIKFSPYGVKFGEQSYHLVLFAITDCLSLWDLSPFVSKIAREDSMDIPTCIGCVAPSGSPLLEFSINQSFSKFSAYDVHGSFFLLKVWEKSNLDSQGCDVNQNGTLV